MKIQQIKFIEHQSFPVNSTLTFFDQSETNIPKIFFIVGNNGAGKTNILESLYYGLKNPHGYKINKFNLEFELLIDSRDVTLKTGNQ